MCCCQGFRFLIRYSLITCKDDARNPDRVPEYFVPHPPLSRSPHPEQLVDHYRSILITPPLFHLEHCVRPSFQKPRVPDIQAVEEDGGIEDNLTQAELAKRTRH